MCERIFAKQRMRRVRTAIELRRPAAKLGKNPPGYGYWSKRTPGPGTEGSWNVVQGGGHLPFGRRAASDSRNRPPETVFRNQAQLGGKAAGILKPDLMDGAVGIRIVEVGGLCRLVVLDGNVVERASWMACSLEMD